jgi:hypothetical protein
MVTRKLVNVLQTAGCQPFADRKVQVGSQTTTPERRFDEIVQGPEAIMPHNHPFFGHISDVGRFQWSKLLHHRKEIGDRYNLAKF